MQIKKQLRFCPIVCIPLLLFAFAGCKEIQNMTTAEPTDTVQQDQIAEAVTEQPYSSIQLTAELTQELTRHLDELSSCVYPTRNTFEAKINNIRSGEQALQLTFSPTDYYYACAYYKTEHLFAEQHNYCCTTNYHWIGFSNEKDIQKTVQGAPLVVAFQINKASLRRDIKNLDATTPTVEHFQRYIPCFENSAGIISNIAAPSECPASFIYLTVQKSSVLYVSKDDTLFENMSFPLIEQNNEIYLTLFLFTELPDGKRNEAPLQLMLGNYYDALSAIMITGQHSISRSDGKIDQYGLFKLNDFLSIVKQGEK